MVDVGTEWRSFADVHHTRDPSRVGAPMRDLTDGVMSTDIRAYGSDHYNLMNQQRKISGGKDDRIMKAMDYIRAKCDQAHIPQCIIDQANLIFKQAELKTHNYEAVAAAAIYIACRKENVPRAFAEIANLTQIEKKKIAVCYKKIVANSHAHRYVNYMDILEKCQRNLNIKNVPLAAKILPKVKDVLSGCSPYTIVGITIYLSCKHLGFKKTMEVIANACDMKEITLKNAHKKIKIFMSEHANTKFEDLFTK
jgi:transcription initiation factor TFIIB